MLDKQQLIQQAITMQFNNIDSKLLLQQIVDWLAHKPVTIDGKVYIFPHGVQQFRIIGRQAIEILQSETK